jgi:hypothetical protein
MEVIASRPNQLFDPACGITLYAQGFIIGGGVPVICATREHEVDDAQHFVGQGDKSSHRLLTEYAKLRKRYWGQHLWGWGYWVASSGNVTDEVWQEYIKSQTPPDPDDDFHVV